MICCRVCRGEGGGHIQQLQLGGLLSLLKVRETLVPLGRTLTASASDGGEEGGRL